VEVQIMAKTRKASTRDKAARQPSNRARKQTTPRNRQAQITALGKATAVVANSPEAAPRPTKKTAVIALLQRPEGAAISELTAATGWQAHSVRAVLTGLRKEGKELVRAKDAAGVTHYWLAGGSMT